MTYTFACPSCKSQCQGFVCGTGADTPENCETCGYRFTDAEAYDIATEAQIDFNVQADEYLRERYYEHLERSCAS